MTHTLNAGDMGKMLREHLAGAPSKPEPGFFIQELEAPRSARRADALWVPLSSQLKGQLFGYEIKVSRQDVMVELADPTKADAWLRYCDRWWLVVADPLMVAGLDIPEHWGILAPPSGRNKRLMTVLRPAPALKPESHELAMVTIMARLYYGAGDAQSRIAWLQKDLQRAYDDVRTAQERQRAAENSLREAEILPGEAERIKAVLRALTTIGMRHGGHQVYGWGADQQVDPEDIARVLLDLGVVRREALALVKRIENSTSQFDRALQAVAGTLASPLEVLNAAKARLEADVSRETKEEQ